MTLSSRRSLTMFFVLAVLLIPIVIFASAKRVRSAEYEGASGFSIWLDGPTQATGDETITYMITTDASGLFGAQVDLEFDPAVLQVVGTQVTPGSCPKPDFVASNIVDNGAGSISYAVTSLFPTPPCDGGVMASFQFKVLPTAVGGSTKVQFTSVILADDDGVEIPATANDLNLEIVGVVAEFSGTPTKGPAPLTVDFTNLSSGDYNSCIWDFGDTNSSSSCANQSHTYTTPGSYSVKLSVNGPGVSDSETKGNYIVVWQYWVNLPVVLAD